MCLALGGVLNIQEKLYVYELLPFKNLSSHARQQQEVIHELGKRPATGTNSVVILTLHFSDNRRQKNILLTLTFRLCSHKSAIG